MIIGPGSKVYNAEGRKLKVGQFIGQGGCGAVYKVEPKLGEQPQALKTLTIPFTAGSEDLQILLNEGKQALRVKHKNVIRYDFFHDGSQFENLPPYILMEYASGGSVADLIDKANTDKKPFSIDMLQDMMSQMVEGMAAINDVLIHRDIKPENILIDGDTLKISDFGLAKLAQEATRKHTFKGFGTFPYMAPEAWKFDANTMLLDIYAMGMVFYELITLQHPFHLNTDDPQKWMQAHLLWPVDSPSKVNPAISPGLSQMIMKMVEKNSTRRAQNWQAVRDLMAVAFTSGSISNPLIQGMMKKRIDADATAESERLKKEKEQQDERDFGKLVVSEANEIIIRPLQEFFEEFNSQYASGKIEARLSQSDFSLALSIMMPNGTGSKIEFRALIESQFWRDQQFQDFGRIITKRVLAVPQLNRRKVQGFGLVQHSNGQGFNFALVEQAGGIYGEWYMLINSDSPLSRKRNRPKPFAFNFNEMEKEIPYVGVGLHVYVTELRPLDMTYIQEFFAEAIA